MPAKDNVDVKDVVGAVDVTKPKRMRRSIMVISGVVLTGFFFALGAWLLSNFNKVTDRLMSVADRYNPINRGGSI